jgi:hypothetical protein
LATDTFTRRAEQGDEARSLAMLSKCANPACSTPLIYLREGKIFMMDDLAVNRSKVQAPVPAKGTGHVEHFWLCGPCSERLTLVYHAEGGIEVVPKNTFSRWAAAS